jgi:hypothetical protein
VVLVKNGLEPGNLVITEGYAQVVDGTLLQIKDKLTPDATNDTEISNR